MNETQVSFDLDTVYLLKKVITASLIPQLRYL